jgi:hypothetical protein
MTSTALTPFEREAIATILRGDHPILAQLRAQAAMCEVSKRELTGVGFFTSLTVPAVVLSAPVSKRLHLGSDVHVSMDGVPHGAGLVLFVEEGRLAVLEGYTYDDPWPDEVANYAIVKGEVTHLGGSQSDLDQIEGRDVPAKRERETGLAVAFWFAVQRMLRRKTEPPWLATPDLYPPDGPDSRDDPLGSGVPRRPPESSGSAAAAAVPDEGAPIE